jgi:hypothetical protein
VRRSILILFFFLLSSCNGREHALPTEPNPAPSTTSTVVGRVLTLDTHQPMPNVVVSFTSAASVVSQTSTDAEGRYSFTGLEPGFYSVRAAEKSTGSVHLTAGVNAHDLFVAADSRCIVPYGTVRDARTGKPIGGAKVTIFNQETTTAADGTYSIDFGCPGFVLGSTITISAKANGYVDYSIFSRASFLCTCSYDILLEPR